MIALRSSLHGLAESLRGGGPSHASGRGRDADQDSRYRALMEHAYDALIVVNRAHRIVDTNRRACELFGYPRDLLIGMDYLSLMDPADLQRRPQQVDAVFSGRKLVLERRMVRRDGTMLAVELSSTRIDDDSILSILRDVTERRRMEESLARSEREYRLLLQEAHDAILVIDPDYRVVEANRAAANLLGYPREELLGLPYASIVEPENLARQPLQIDASFAGQPVSLQRRFLRKDGSVVEVELGSTRIDDGRILTIVRDTTERSRTEAALARREREYRLLMERASDAIFVVNPEFIIQDVNDRACRMLGYDRNEMIGRLCTSIVDRADLQRLPLQVGRAFRGESITLERRCRRRDGSTVDAELSLAPVDSRRVMVIARDVSERRAAEAALRESEEMFRTLLGAVFDGIVISEGEAIVEANAAFERLLGRKRSELLGRDFLTLVAPESRPIVHQMRRQGTLEPFEITALHTEGHTVFLECIAQSRLRDGRLVRVKALRDITQRKRDELALRTSEARLREAQQIAKLGSWVLDLETDTVIVTEEFSRIMGLQPHERELPVEQIWPVVHPDELEALKRLHQDVLAGWRDAFDIEFRLRGRNGKEPVVQSKAAMMRDQDGRPLRLVGTLQDLTERKALERQLAQAMKLEAIGKLTGGVAHDFNNLLTIVVGNLRLMERELGAANSFLSEALQAAERGSHLVQRLLAYGRRQPMRTEPISVNGLIDETAQLLKRTLGETIAVETRLAQHLWPACTDRSQLETALINLALNARDAMPDGGRLRIETCNVQESRKRRRTNGRPPGDYVRIAVRDSGVGMTPDVLEHAFEPFFTTKEVGQGSGLGLSMIYGFAEQCGGFVEIQSTVGQGTAVELYLPRSEELPADLCPPRAEGQPHNGHGAGRTILLVEDDPGVRLVTALTLRTLGYRVVDAPNGVAALRMLADLPKVDLLFTDIVMPHGPTGLELAREAQRLRPSLRVLLTTGYCDSLLGPVGGPCSPWPLLPKPYDTEKLQTRLNEVLDVAPAPA